MLCKCRLELFGFGEYEITSALNTWLLGNAIFVARHAALKEQRIYV